MSYKVVIPARYASERLPGKPLLEIQGKPMLQLTWEKACSSSAEQVIIATDGDFNEGEENINCLVRKYKRKGITLSVIGVKNTTLIKIIMEDLANKGGGNYIPVYNYNDALTSLVKEIKQNSYIPFNK